MALLAAGRSCRRPLAQRGTYGLSHREPWQLDEEHASLTRQIADAQRAAHRLYPSSADGET